MHSVDISGQKFHCLKCGICCYNVLREETIDDYGFNFRGEWVRNPKSSLVILYNEKFELEQNLINYDLQARFYPQVVFFMKDYPVGFIYSYQLGVKKKKYCMFYDLSKLECKIYPIRPMICRVYPLGPNSFNGLNFLPEGTCLGATEMIRLVDSSFKEGELVYFPTSQKQMSSAYPVEFFLLTNVMNFNSWELEIILENLGSMFNLEKSMTASRVEEYTLLNFRDFIGWTRKNITNKQQKLMVQQFSQKLEFGKQHFAQQLATMFSKRKF